MFLYACETWTLTADLERRISAMEMRCYRRLLGISYSQHITNEEIRRRITQEIGAHEDLLTTVKKRKLKWYGHVTTSSGLSKTILQGTVQGVGGKQEDQRSAGLATSKTGLASASLTLRRQQETAKGGDM